MILKINKILKKIEIPSMYISGALILVALIISKVSNIKSISNIIYIISFILSGLPILIRAIQSLKFKTVSIELLVSIASIGACFIGEFNESAIVTFLFQFGLHLEQKTITKTRRAIKLLTDMTPKVAYRIINSELKVEMIDAEDVEVNDLLLVKTGNQIASDGIVTFGEGYVNESSITGESVLVKKNIGDILYAGTILDSGTLQMKSTKVGEDTTFSKIVSLVEEAQDAKSPAEKFIDKFSRYYTPLIIIISFIVFILFKSIDTAITVLVLACPGALVIGAPIANVAGIGKGAREGILLKGGDSINSYSKTNFILFDKTGTLTEGKTMVTTEKCYSDDRDQTLKIILSIEKNSDHPIAKALIGYTKDKKSIKVDKVEQIKGQGIIATVKGNNIIIGNRKIIESNNVVITEKIEKEIHKIQEQGSSVVIVSENNKITMLLGVNDSLKQDAISSINELKKIGIKNITMLTGDNNVTAKKIAQKLKINYESDLLPEDKQNYVKKLQNKGYNVTFVGDGVNDSPSIISANTGIAMGSGTDVAIESSDVVLINSNLRSMVNSLKLAKETTKILYENIFIAILTVIILLIGLIMGYIHMSSGMLIHEGSIMVVILNAMRLLISHKDKEN